MSNFGLKGCSTIVVNEGSFKSHNTEMDHKDGANDIKISENDKWNRVKNLAYQAGFELAWQFAHQD